MWRSTVDEKKSPWSSGSEMGIDSLADWLIPTLGHPDVFTYFYFCINKREQIYKNDDVCVCVCVFVCVYICVSE